MAFVNEWISEEDMEKYHIREIREKMVADRGRPDWVRDKERDMYLMQIRGLGQANEYEGMRDQESDLCYLSSVGSQSLQ